MALKQTWRISHQRLAATLALLATIFGCMAPAVIAQEAAAPQQESVEVVTPMAAIPGKLQAESPVAETALPDATPPTLIAEPVLPPVAGQPTGAARPPQPMLKGQVNYCVPMGTPIKMKLATVPLFKMNLMNRDLEGNLLPAKMNAPVTAKVTEDIYVDDNKVIPAGTVFKGRVSQVFPPRRVGRPGAYALEFNTFTTPDGRTFKFHVAADSKQKSTWKTKARGAGRIAAHAAGGAIVGALVAYKIFGLEQTIAMHGYNIAGGAAAGAAVGIAIALWTKGKKAVLEPGDDLNMHFDSDLLIPAATAPTVKKEPPKLEGLEIHILKSKLMKDGLDGHQLRIKAVVLNETDRELRSMDLFMIDDNGKRHSVVTDSDERAETIFHIEPGSQRQIYFAFEVEYPKLKRKLVWIDPISRRVLHEQPLP